MKRVFINTLKNIRRAPYQALAAILVLILTFLITQLFILISLGSEKIIKYFETRPQVTAFFNDDVKEDAIMQLKQQLELQNYVREVKYVSKQEALQIYREQNQDDPLLLEMVTADILPASIEVAATSIENLATVKNTLSEAKGIEELVYQQDVIEALKKWTGGLRSGGLVIVGFLAATSLMVIYIITSMKVATKRQEIATLRLLGAGSWFIHGPFLLEGALYGIIASIISWGLLYIMLLYSTPLLVDFFGDINLLPIPLITMLELLAAMLAFSTLIGMISGSLSSRRFGN